MGSRKLKILMAAVLLMGVYVAAHVCLPMGVNNTATGQTDVERQTDGEPGQVNIDYTSKTVIIDSGHGGIDPGKTSADGILEKDINLAIAKKLETLLQCVGVNVIMTRTEDMGHYNESDTNKKRTDMKARCEMINNSGADVVVSIHQNSYTGAAVKGAQMFYYEGSAEGKKLAGILQKAFVEYVDGSNKRVEKADSSYYMLLNTTPPTVIAECGFLSNPQEAKLLNTDDYQQKVAKALCSGILEYLAQ